MAAKSKKCASVLTQVARERSPSASLRRVRLSSFVDLLASLIGRPAIESLVPQQRRDSVGDLRYF